MASPSRARTQAQETGARASDTRKLDDVESRTKVASGRSRLAQTRISVRCIAQLCKRAARWPRTEQRYLAIHKVLGVSVRSSVLCRRTARSMLILRAASRIGGMYCRMM